MIGSGVGRRAALCPGSLNLSYLSFFILTETLEVGHFTCEEWRLRGVNLLVQSYKVHNSQRLAWMEPRSDLLLNPCIFFFLPLLLVNFVLFHEPKCMLIPSPGVINLSCWLQSGLVLRVSLEKRLKVMGEVRACTKWCVS